MARQIWLGTIAKDPVKLSAISQGAPDVIQVRIVQHLTDGEFIESTEDLTFLPRGRGCIREHIQLVMQHIWEENIAQPLCSI